MLFSPAGRRGHQPQHRTRRRALAQAHPGEQRGRGLPDSSQAHLLTYSSFSFYSHCRPNPLRPPGVLGGGDPQRPEIIGRLPVFWGVPSDRRISAPAFASPVRVPRPHRSHCPGPTLHVDSDKVGHPGARMNHRHSCTDHPPPRQPDSRPPRTARVSVPAAGLTRSTTSLCRSRAFCFPLGVSEALNGARSCSSKSSRRPRSRCGEAAAGPWGRMARSGPGTRGAGGGAGGDAEPGRDQSLAPPRSEAAAGCINAPFTRAPPSLPPSLPPLWTP